MRFVLCTLLAVVCLAQPAAAKKADRIPNETVSQIKDERIRESSGLAVSAKHDDLVYTINDRGSDPAVYAVRISTGKVVGTTDISELDVEDTESIAVDADGTLWLGDLGDNDHQRDNVSILSFPEPGPGDHHITSADRTGVKFPDGPVDVEGMLIHPETSRIHLVSKNREGNGTVYELPKLTDGKTVTARDLKVEAPQAVTDATYTAGGEHALLRTNDAIFVYDPTTWELRIQQDTPKVRQGESIAMEPGDRTVLFGSEGKNSPLVRISTPTRQAGSDAPTADREAVSQSASVGSIVMVGALAVLMAGLAFAFRRRISSQSYQFPGW
jgi:hypothetical protein